MKRILAIIMCVVFSISLFGCSSAEESNDNKSIFEIARENKAKREK